MMKINVILAIGLLMCLSTLSFADIGPSPPQPIVIVHLVRNGVPDTNVNQITYHCLGMNNTDDGAVSARLAELQCTDGTCRNGNWFYKFNPCFNFASGFFSYVSGNLARDSEPFSISERKDVYEMTLDTGSGSFVTPTNPEPAPNPPSCLPSFALPMLVLATLAIWRR